MYCTAVYKKKRGWCEDREAVHVLLWRTGGRRNVLYCWLLVEKRLVGG
jgi:hypothetical protein